MSAGPGSRTAAQAPSRGPDLRFLLAPFAGCGAGTLEAAAAGSFAHDGRTHCIPRYRFVGPEAGHERIRLGVFAGVHGDEPAGCLAAAQFAAALGAEPSRAAGYDLTFFPACNPVGLEAGTRENGRGKDLNREFWQGSPEPEVAILEAELRARRFDGIITLHTDDTSEGLYGYSHGRLLDEALLKPALAAAARILPCDPRERIDGFAARQSVIRDCFPGVLAACPAQRPQPFDLIFETPGREPLELQASAAALALETILALYRQFIAYGQDL